MIEVGDEFILTSQGIRLKVEHVFPAREAAPAEYDLPARPAVVETYLVIEMDGPTPGVSWAASASFFESHCTRVQELTKQV